MSDSFPIDNIRQQFPALKRTVNNHPAVFFDGPAGSQVPQLVIDAIGEYLIQMNANHGGAFATSFESDELLEEAHRAVADFVGCSDPDLVSFGPNMTTLTFALSRALSKTWKPGDEIIVSRLDHDANFTPWVLAAKDAGATVKYIDINPADCTLDQTQFQSLLSSNTKLLAVGCASNAVGTINPIETMIQQVHQVDGLVFLDAVHSAPHTLLKAEAWDCDFLACSAYKFFGPHIGIMYGKRNLLESLPAYKLRPAPNELPGRWMTGTQSHEGIAGTLAAVNYLASLGGYEFNGDVSRRTALEKTYELIHKYEKKLAVYFTQKIQQFPSIKLWGISDLDRFSARVPTFSFTHATKTPHEIAVFLAERGVFVWHGNYYALPLTEALNLEPEGMVRVGLLHYNTTAEIDRLITALQELEEA